MRGGFYGTLTAALFYIASSAAGNEEKSLTQLELLNEVDVDGVSWDCRVTDHMLIAATPPNENSAIHAVVYVKDDEKLRFATQRGKMKLSESSIDELLEACTEEKPAEKSD